MRDKKSSKIFLTGFMGAGKTSVARYLAQFLHCPWVDIDEQIVLDKGRSVSDIFAQEGEDYFRNCETEFLKAISEGDSKVYATGGGIVTRQQNRLRMHELGTIVFLKTDWLTLRKRLEKSYGRPLIEQDGDWKRINRLWESRKDDYLDADIIVDTDKMTPRAVALLIQEKLVKGN